MVYSFVMAILMLLEPLAIAAMTPGCLETVKLSGVDPAIVFVSDTQEPMLVERLWLKYQDNAQVTRRLFASIATQHPDAVFHGGDLVATGSFQSKWDSFWEAFPPCPL